jgi:hypothetical protein
MADIDLKGGDSWYRGEGKGDRGVTDDEPTSIPPRTNLGRRGHGDLPKVTLDTGRDRRPKCAGMLSGACQLLLA